MKIVFAIPALSDGGAQRQVVALLNEMQSDLGLDLTLFTLGAGEHDHELDTSRLRLYRGVSRSNMHPRAGLAFMSMLASTRPDLLVTWLHSCDVLGGLTHRVSPNTQWVMTERNSSYPRALRYRAREVVGRRAPTIVSNSEPGRQYWTKLGARGRLEVIPNIIVPTAKTDSQYSRKNAIVYVGRLESKKNIETVVRAFAVVAKSRQDLHFQVIGKGSLASELEEIIRVLGMSKRISMMGFRQDARQLIADARLLVSMSHQEGMPNVVTEALGSGTPVLLSDIAEHRAVVGDAYPHLVRDRRNVEEVAAGVHRALSDRNLTMAAEEAMKRLGSLDAASIADRYLSLFRSLVNKPCGQL